MSRPTILLTGITGFVGGALAARLLAAGYSLIAIARADTAEDAHRRVARSLSRFLGSNDGERAAASVSVVVGDVASDQTYLRPELDHVTHVVHAAACTSFVSTREVWRTNVDGTKKLAERMRSVPSLRRFLHVSTAYCCGDRPKRVVHEDDAPRADHAHVNGYASSKASAEMLLASMGWGDRLLVARPSVVVGHTALGVRPSSSLFWYYRAMAALGRGPFELDDRRDVVPVDYVADALAFLLMLERPKCAAYHVSAGEEASSSLREILNRFDVPKRPAWRKVSSAALADMSSALGPLVRSDDEATRLARALGACAKFGELAVQCFDNRRLRSEGFGAPPSFVDYLDVCVRTSAGATIFEQMIDDA